MGESVPRPDRLLSPDLVNVVFGLPEPILLLSPGFRHSAGESRRCNSCSRVKQSGEPVAAVGVAERDRQVVTDEFAAAVGDDRWPSDQACVVLAAAGREPSDTAAVRGAQVRRAFMPAGPCGRSGRFSRNRRIEPAPRSLRWRTSVVKPTVYRLCDLANLAADGKFRFHSRLASTRLCLGTLMRIQQR